jgi:hypothetical protein
MPMQEGGELRVVVAVRLVGDERVGLERAFRADGLVGLGIERTSED